MAMTEKELNSKDILDAVSSFYVNNHFNDTSDIDKEKRLNTTNIIRSAYLIYMHICEVAIITKYLKLDVGQGG